MTNFAEVEQIVEGQLAKVQEGADSYIQIANEVIQQLQQFVPIAEPAQPPKIDFPDLDPLTYDPGSTPDVNKFGQIDPYKPPTPFTLDAPPGSFQFGPPGSPSLNFNFTNPAYSSPIDSPLTTKVELLLAGKIEITEALEANLYERARSRVSDATLSLTQQAFDTFVSRGFAMPPGMLVAQVNAANEKGRQELSAANREIMTQSGQWQIDSVKTALTTGLQYEGLNRESFEKAVQRSWDLVKIQNELNVQLFGLTGEVYKMQVGAYTASVSAYSEISKAKVDSYTASVNAAKVQVEAQAAAIEATAKAYTADVALFESESKLKISVNEANVQMIEARLRNTVSYYEISLRQFESDLSRLIEQAKIHIMALDAAGRMATQMAAGYTAAVHVQASLNGSGSASDDQRVSVNYDVQTDSPPIFG